jgi:nucleotide-binding universal stress UspA family protein
MYKHILLPVDGSETSLRAARHGIALACALHAKVTAVIVTTPWATRFAREPAAVVPEVVVPETAYEAKAKTAAGAILASVAEQAQHANVHCRTVHRGHRDAYQAIIDVAMSEGCELIVMGSHGRRGIAGLLLGSETAKVLAHSTLPVLVYRGT